MKIRQLISAMVMVGSMLAASAAFPLSELATAVVNDEATLVQTLIRQNADVNAVEKDGSTALLLAIYNENPGIVKSLLDAGADPGASNREGMVPLALAAITGHAGITEMLLDAGAGVNQGLRNGETPLMMAARTGDVETMQIILDRGANINATENLRGTSAAMWAAAYKNADALQLLIEHGADISLNSNTTSPGRGPYLSPKARSRVMQYVLGVTVEEGGSDLVIPQEFEGEDGKGDPNVLSREEIRARLPADLIAEFEAERIAMREARSSTVTRIPRKQWGGLTTLHFAVREGDLASVKVLVEAGADVNQISEFGWSPLLVATQNRYYEIGQYLLENGANPNIANEGGWNSLYIATDNRNIEGGDYPTRKPDMDHLDFIKLLLEAGADPNIRMASSTETRTIFTHQWLYEEGATPFLRAAQSSDIELLRLLLEYGADPTINTTDGVTPLMVAAGIGWVEGVTYEWSEQANRETIQLLLDLGADAAEADKVDRRTALMGAGHKGRNYAVQMLADAGADLAARDIGSRDSMHRLGGATWQAIDYADGLVRIGVQSSIAHPETFALLRELMLAEGLKVPEEGRTLDSICIVDICK